MSEKVYENTYNAIWTLKTIAQNTLPNSSFTYIESAMPFETKRQPARPELKGDNRINNYNRNIQNKKRKSLIKKSTWLNLSCLSYIQFY